MCVWPLSWAESGGLAAGGTGVAPGCSEPATLVLGAGVDGVGWPLAAPGAVTWVVGVVFVP